MCTSGYYNLFLFWLANYKRIVSFESTVWSVAKSVEFELISIRLLADDHVEVESFLEHLGQ